ncbi:MAG: hypothetical protein SWH61_00900 [Thermodesulfobacteriota bacterium]|nr:hypothetical protein [Thermodesulfobacteriota bacterium]
MTNHQDDSIIKALMEKGVTIPVPESVEIGADVAVDRISGEGTVIHAGCRIHGAATFISRDAIIGNEGPVTMENCHIGPGVKLGSGFLTETVLLANARTGGNTHCRKGTILEEYASLAHSVGVKQTILFPFVTLGSLINFCDCLMAGGTSTFNHSEVGSSYIHFNYSPNQDKATASLFGDVPRGVMLRENPVFLGGQGGAVGPLRITFGTVTAAGTICRKDELTPGKLVIEPSLKGGSFPYQSGIYVNIRRILVNNINYIANLIALMRWYEYVRPMFMHPTEFPGPMVDGLKEKLRYGVEERIKQLDRLCENMPRSIQLYQNGKQAASEKLMTQKEELYEKNEVVCEMLELLLKNETGSIDSRDDFLSRVEQAMYDFGSNDYVDIIQAIDDGDAAVGTIWLRSVVDNVVDRIGDLLPSFNLIVQ